MIPYGRQQIDDDDIAAVVAVLRSERLTQGPAVDRFEADLVELTGARFAVAYSNGTAALHGACWAAGLGPGSVVGTSSLSFAASANCGRYVGADIEFIDIDPETLNLDPSAVPNNLDALVAVHYAGLPVELTRLDYRPRIVIEDAAHAIGAATEDGPVGNCARSDMCCFSFHPVKTITTGEGGAVTTNDPDLAERLRSFRHHGIRPTPANGAWSYAIDEVGYNYRLTDIQAALGSSQLAKLDKFVFRRGELANRYDQSFEGHPGVVTPPRAPGGTVHGRHLYPIRVANRGAVYAELHARGIGPQVHYVPIHTQPAYADTRHDCPQTDRAYAELLSLPLFPGLTPDEQDHVIDSVLEVTRP